MDDELHELSGELVVQAARFVRAVRRLSDSPGGALRVVSLLDEHGPLSVSALARVDRCSQPTMSGAVASLVQRGWVAKTPDPADARSALVVLTAAGRAELARARTIHADAVAAVIAAHPEHDLEDLRTTVAVLRALLSHTSEGNL